MNKPTENYLRQQIDIAIAELPCSAAFDGVHIWLAMSFKRYWRKDIYRCLDELTDQGGLTRDGMGWYRKPR